MAMTFLGIYHGNYLVFFKDANTMVDQYGMVYFGVYTRYMIYI